MCAKERASSDQRGKEIQPTAGRMTAEVEANSAAAQIVAVGNISSPGHVLYLRHT